MKTGDEDDEGGRGGSGRRGERGFSTPTGLVDGAAEDGEDVDKEGEKGYAEGARDMAEFWTQKRW